ncbi:MAG TPA: glycosyltransferase, partial [Roseiflexaceae bacterium]|nr:glycosyltransferase [Roseiflexaceae bacterium]
IQQQIGRLGLEQRVMVTGHCPEAEVSAHLLAADIATLPFTGGASFRRGSLLAALAHGLPVVTTTPTKDQGQKTKEDTHTLTVSLHRSSSVFRPLVDGENALLVPPGDAAALAEAIERMGRDARLRERLAVGGRALAAQFGWDAIAAQHERLYARLIRR